MNRYAPDYFPSRKLAIPTQVRAGGVSQGGAVRRAANRNNRLPVAIAPQYIGSAAGASSVQRPP